MQEHFREMLNEVRQILHVEYQTNKITKDQYYDALKDTINNILQLSVQYELDRARLDLEKEKVGKDIELKNKQIEIMDREIQLKERAADSDIALNNKKIESMQIEDTIKQQQSVKDLAIKDKQLDQIQSDIDLNNQRIASMQLDDTIKQQQLVKELDLKDAQIARTNKEVEKIQKDIDYEAFRIRNEDPSTVGTKAYYEKQLMIAQAELANRQRDGYDDNMLIKLFAAQTNGYSMMAASILNEITNAPSIFQNDALLNTYNTIFSRATS